MLYLVFTAILIAYKVLASKGISDRFKKSKEIIARANNYVDKTYDSLNSQPILSIDTLSKVITFYRWIFVFSMVILIITSSFKGIDIFHQIHLELSYLFVGAMVLCTTISTKEELDISIRNILRGVQIIGSIALFICAVFYNYNYNLEKVELHNLIYTVVLLFCLALYKSLIRLITTTVSIISIFAVKNCYRIGKFFDSKKPIGGMLLIITIISGFLTIYQRLLL